VQQAIRTYIRITTYIEHAAHGTGRGTVHSAASRPTQKDRTRASHRIELKQIITQSAQKHRKILILISSSKGQQCHIAYGRILTQDILHASS